MSHQLGNLLECPMHKIEDRKAILQRVYESLIADPEAALDFRGGHRYTADELANWAARQTVADLLAAFPTSSTGSDRATDFGAVRTEPVDS